EQHEQKPSHAGRPSAAVPRRGWRLLSTPSQPSRRPGSPACCSSSCVATRCAASCSASSVRHCRWAEMSHPCRRPGRRRPVPAALHGGRRGPVTASSAGGQRGSVTAELALLLPAVVVVLLVCATLGAAA